MVDQRYARLAEGAPVYLFLPIKLREPVEIGGVVHPEGALLFTDDAAALLAQGYKPVTKLPMPSEAGYTYLGEWRETETEIIRDWQAIKLPDDPYQIIDTLTGEAI